MKKIYLALLSVFFLVTIGFAQTTVTINCTGAPGSFNSGYVTSTDVRSDGNLEAVTTTPIVKRGWATFDLSGIPAGSVVNSVDIRFRTTQLGGTGGNSRLYGFLGDPTAMSNATLYDACDNGPMLY